MRSSAPLIVPLPRQTAGRPGRGSRAGDDAGRSPRRCLQDRQRLAMRGIDPGPAAAPEHGMTGDDPALFEDPHLGRVVLHLDRPPRLDQTHPPPQHAVSVVWRLRQLGWERRSSARLGPDPVAAMGSPTGSVSSIRAGVSGDMSRRVTAHSSLASNSEARARHWSERPAERADRAEHGLAVGKRGGASEPAGGRIARRVGRRWWAG
jgi:hypothetical protein